jgi:pimeloyl-ACP methyl ester carboxylesterase
MRQQIQYCTTSDGVGIAYAVTGEGTPIVRTSHWLTHLEHDFTSPVWKHVMLALTRHHRLVRYDPRGEGLSQRECADLSFDAWMKDLEAVVEAASLPRFALFGCSQGAATAVAYAVKHPDRVSHLILYGGFARGPLKRAGSPEVARRRIDLAKDLILEGWGTKHEAHRQWFTSSFLPQGSVDQYRWFNRLQQVSASPDIAARHLEATALLDVAALLPTVTTPTLVLHCRDDGVVPFEVGQELAASIPGARLVPLEGENHLFLADSPAHREFVYAVFDFLGDPQPRGHLPGTRSFWERIDHRIRTAEQYWAIKAAVLVGAVIGLVLSVIQLLQVAG